jgi:hypothetical protein
MVTTLHTTIAQSNKGQTPVFAGITFGDETLSIYDEGVWSPTITIGGVDITAIASSPTGYYTQIGDRVFITATFKFNRAALTGDIAGAGLPFTSSASNNVPLMFFGGDNVDLSPFLVASIGASTNSITFQKVGGSTSASLVTVNDTQVAASTECEFYVAGMYTV